jgi:membrane protein DedA with SNARE-associated domain
VAPKSLREASVKSREPSDLCTTSYSIFSDIGNLNFPLAIIYSFICSFMGSGITSEYIACDDTE